MRGWLDPLKCSWVQALRSRIELSCRLGSAAEFGAEAETAERVVVAPMTNATAGEQDAQQVHVALAYGSMYHVPACCPHGCPQLDPGSAMVTWQEANS